MLVTKNDTLIHFRFSFREL